MGRNEIKVKVSTQARQYNTLPNLNRNIKFFGLGSLQFMGLLVVLMIIFIIHWIVGIVMLVPVYFLVMKIYKEEKKGNPGIIESKMNYQAMPKKLIDKKRVLQYLKK